MKRKKKGKEDLVLSPQLLGKLLREAAYAGERLGEGFFFYEITPEGVIFPQCRGWKRGLLVRWSGEEEEREL